MTRNLEPYWKDRGGPMRNQRVYHRVQCAIITRGCTSALVWSDTYSGDEISEYGKDLLRLNGWRLDHERWICGNH